MYYASALEYLKAHNTKPLTQRTDSLLKLHWRRSEYLTLSNLRSRTTLSIRQLQFVVARAGFIQDGEHYSLNTQLYDLGHSQGLFYPVGLPYSFPDVGIDMSRPTGPRTTNLSRSQLVTLDFTPISMELAKAMDPFIKTNEDLKLLAQQLAGMVYSAGMSLNDEESGE